MAITKTINFYGKRYHLDEWDTKMGNLTPRINVLKKYGIKHTIRVVDYSTKKFPNQKAYVIYSEKKR